MAKKDTLRWIGIDPGKGGAIACIDVYGVIEARHTPMITTRIKSPRAKTAAGNVRVKVTTEYDFFGILDLLEKLTRPCGDTTVVIERQWGRPRDSKGAIFEVGRGYGIWQMAIAAMGLAAMEVVPQTWRPCYVGVRADKQKSKEVCQILYPEYSLPLKRDEAKAEAILIADYGKRLELQFPMFSG